MTRIGFSTGALGYGDFSSALQILSRHPIRVVELSALREHEVDPLLGSVERLDLCRFSYISFHAPSALAPGNELQLVEKIKGAIPEQWPVILHPDAAHHLEEWRIFGAQVAIENMDKRKPVGRSVPELLRIFERVPEASFCFDIGHARQCDPTMTEAWLLLETFGDRLRQVHISEVTTASRHDRLSESAISAFQIVAELIPKDVPVIIEAPVKESEIQGEVERVRRALTPMPIGQVAG